MTPEERWRWMDSGLCAQTDPELFFPDKGGSTKTSKGLCRKCPVIDPCLDFAMADENTLGVWGGTSTRDRMRMWREGWTREVAA